MDLGVDVVLSIPYLDRSGNMCVFISFGYYIFVVARRPCFPEGNNPMNDMTNTATDSGLSFSRRAMLKAAGVTAVGAGLFAGTASANSLNEIHFCGCSQVCVDSNGFGFVVFGWETDDGWDHKAVSFSQIAYGTGNGVTEDERVRFCYTVEEFLEDYDVGGTEHKIIAVRQDGCNFCNPGQCASKALADLDEILIPGVGDVSFGECDTRGYGQVTCSGDKFGEPETVNVFKSNCGLYGEDGEERSGGPPEVRGRSGK